MHSSRREERWRLKDSVPEGFRLIYIAPMEWYIRCAAVAASVPLALGVISIPMLYLAPPEMPVTAPQVGLTITLFSVLASGIFLVTRRYPFRMYHSRSQKEYSAVLVGPLLLNSRLVSLSEGSVSQEHGGDSGVVPWKKVLYRSPRGKLILHDTAFKSADDYNRLLGYTLDQDDEDDTFPGARGM